MPSVRSAAIGLSCLVALWWLVAWVFSSDRGLGFRDEGLYLLAADPPSPTARWVTPFGWHTAPFFSMVGHDVADLRTFAVCVLVVVGALFGWTVGRRVTDSTDGASGRAVALGARRGGRIRGAAAHQRIAAHTRLQLGEPHRAAARRHRCGAGDDGVRPRLVVAFTPSARGCRGAVTGRVVHRAGEAVEPRRCSSWSRRCSWCRCSGDAPGRSLRSPPCGVSAGRPSASSPAGGPPTSSACCERSARFPPLDRNQTIPGAFMDVLRTPKVAWKDLALLRPATHRADGRRRASWRSSRTGALARVACCALRHWCSPPSPPSAPLSRGRCSGLPTRRCGSTGTAPPTPRCVAVRRCAVAPRGQLADHRPDAADSRGVAVAALCIAAVFIFGFGSAMSIYHQAALAASLMWCAAAAVVATVGEPRLRVCRCRRVVAASLVMLVSNVVDSRHHPFDVSSTARADRRPTHSAPTTTNCSSTTHRARYRSTSCNRWRDEAGSAPATR